MENDDMGQVVMLESQYAVRSALVRRLEAEAGLATLKWEREKQRWDKEQEPVWTRFAVASAVCMILLIRFV